MLDKDNRLLHELIRDDIVEKIESGVYSPGARLNTETELAEMYGTSRTTIRQALGDLAAQGYIDRSKRRGTFIRPSASSAKDAWVGMIVPDLFGHIVHRTTAGAEKALAQVGLGLRLYANYHSISDTEAAIRCALDEGAVGLIIYTPEDSTYSRAVHELKLKGFPVCLFDRPYGQLATDCVMTDHAEGGYMATSHLVSQGHRQIGFVASSSLDLTYSSGARYGGYQAALSQGGIELRPEWVVCGRMHDESWIDKMRDMLSSDVRPSSIFAVNDSVAAMAIQTAISLGIRLPDELAIVGFDNTDVVARLSVPLTTIEQPFEDIGRTAVEMLLERLNGKRTSISWVVLPPKLVVRRSCGSLPKVTA